MLQPRHDGRRMKTAAQEHGVPHIAVLRSLTGFTIVQVFTKRRLGHVLIKPDIYTGTAAKSHRGEWDLKR